MFIWPIYFCVGIKKSEFTNQSLLNIIKPRLPWLYFIITSFMTNTYMWDGAKVAPAPIWGWHGMAPACALCKDVRSWMPLCLKPVMQKGEHHWFFVLPNHQPIEIWAIRAFSGRKAIGLDNPSGPRPHGVEAAQSPAAPFNFQPCFFSWREHD